MSVSKPHSHLRLAIKNALVVKYQGNESMYREAIHALDSLEEQLEAAREEILFLCSDEDDIRKGLREQLKALQAEHTKLVESAFVETPLEPLADHQAAHREIVELKEQLETYREFYDAHWEVEIQVADFDLHAEAVSRLEAAHEAVRRLASSPASNPSVHTVTETGMGSAGYCGRHGLFTGRMCSPCAEEAASVPASDPLGYIELDEHGMCSHDYAKGLGCHVCDPASEREARFQEAAEVVTQAWNLEPNPASEPTPLQRAYGGKVRTVSTDASNQDSEGVLGRSAVADHRLAPSEAPNTGTKP